jgi:hypothetical protein
MKRLIYAISSVFLLVCDYVDFTYLEYFSEILL